MSGIWIDPEIMRENPNTPKAKGRAESTKGGRTRGIMSFNPPPNSCHIKVMVRQPPMPPIKGSMRWKHENGNCEGDSGGRSVNVMPSTR
jgi:hypothetical protein